MSTNVAEVGKTMRVLFKRITKLNEEAFKPLKQLPELRGLVDSVLKAHFRRFGMDPSDMRMSSRDGSLFLQQWERYRKNVESIKPLLLKASKLKADLLAVPATATDTDQPNQFVPSQSPTSIHASNAKFLSQFQTVQQHKVNLSTNQGKTAAVNSQANNGSIILWAFLNQIEAGKMAAGKTGPTGIPNLMGQFDDIQKLATFCDVELPKVHDMIELYNETSARNARSRSVQTLAVSQVADAQSNKANPAATSKDTSQEQIFNPNEIVMRIGGQEFNRGQILAFTPIQLSAVVEAVVKELDNQSQFVQVQKQVRVQGEAKESGDIGNIQWKARVPVEGLLHIPSNVLEIANQKAFTARM